VSMCKLLYKLIQQIAGKKMGPCSPSMSAILPFCGRALAH
jgi:hypothetical protein